MSGDGPITHTPYDLGFDLPHELSGQLRLSHRNRWDVQDDRIDEFLIAEFDLSADFGSYVRIKFDSPTIFRVLDETWLSTATNSNRWTGDLSSFARTVDGDDFARMHSHFFDVTENARHYQFVTNSACLDVIACVPPTISLHR